MDVPLPLQSNNAVNTVERWTEAVNLMDGSGEVPESARMFVQYTLAMQPPFSPSPKPTQYILQIKRNCQLEAVHRYKLKHGGDKVDR
jgi:hypothetical protein